MHRFSLVFGKMIAPSRERSLSTEQRRVQRRFWSLKSMLTLFHVKRLLNSQNLKFKFYMLFKIFRLTLKYEI